MAACLERIKNEQMDESSTLDGSIFTVKSDTPMLEDSKKEYRYGWCRFTPGIFQKLNNPKWLLACLSLCAICQGMLINAFVPVAITTLEKRFQFSAFQLGVFVASYDITILIVQMPVCYFGEKGHKSRWLGMGMLLMALGSAVCVLPQFISGIYTYEANVTQEEVCHLEERPYSAAKSYEQTVLIYVFFIGGQILHGIGASPLYTIGVTFMNENVRKDSSPMYLGVFFGCSVLGPAIGYIVGGLLLRIYGDVWKVDLDMIKITYEDVRWYGAWWICFMIISCLAVVSSLMVSGFDRKLPNAPEHHELVGIEKKSDEIGTDQASSNSSDSSFDLSVNGFKGIYFAFKRLMTCKTWICLLVVDCLEGLPSTGIVAFFPKILENFFSLSSSVASLFTGCAIVPAAFLGNILGGFLIRKFHLQIPGMLSLAMAFDCVALFSILTFLAQCSRPSLAGVTVPYGYDANDKFQIVAPLPANLSHQCNHNCHCSKTLFNPVCDTNRSLVYYSACFAGCSSKTNEGYESCSCLTEPYFNSSSKPSPISLIPGFCSSQCESIITFLVFFTILVFASFMTAIPIQESQLRAVPFELRTFAFGIRWIFVRLFGTIPGPLLFGYLVDQSCILWTQSYENFGPKSKCVIYNNHKLGHYVIAGGMIFKMAVILFLFIARRVCLREEEFIKTTTAKSSQNSSNAKFSTNSKKTRKLIKKNDSDVSLQTNETAISVSLFA